MHGLISLFSHTLATIYNKYIQKCILIWRVPTMSYPWVIHCISIIVLCKILFKPVLCSKLETFFASQKMTEIVLSSQLHKFCVYIFSIICLANDCTRICIINQWLNPSYHIPEANTGYKSIWHLTNRTGFADVKVGAWGAGWVNIV